MIDTISAATTVVSSSSRWFNGVVQGSIDVNPQSRTSDTYLPWQTNGEYGGICGTPYFHDIPHRSNTPIIFAHGNTGDATDWLPTMKSFLDSGHTGEDLWAITFRRSSPSHEEMATQLDSFIQRVRDFTGHDTVHVVSHSLGVTGVRYWLNKYERHSWVDKFVGLAGANHGSSRCKIFGQKQIGFGPARTNWFLNPENLDDPDHPLVQLNENETPGGIKYYTLRGSDDRFFRDDPQSPKLHGAKNEIVEADHEELLTSNEVHGRLYRWLVP